MNNESVDKSNTAKISKSEDVNESQRKGQGDNFCLKNCSVPNSQYSVNANLMGNPRKWLSSGESISNDTRSQSLPDCHDIKVNNFIAKDAQVTQNHFSNNKTSGATSPIQDYWFNTWPEKLHRSSENIESHSKVYENNDCDKRLKVNKNIIKDLEESNLRYKHLTLNEALDTFKLAYNPVTKQLQLADKTQDFEKGNIESPSDSASDSVNEKVGKGHHRTVGASSFSSTISSLSEPSSSGSLLDNEEYNANSISSKLKRRPFSGFFSRKVFSSTGSWRLFGAGKSSSTESLNISENLVASSSALIQHIRPSTLPAKDSEEERRHRDEYEAILQAARKREIENSKARRMKQERQLKQEEQLSAAAKIWANNILPSWDVMCNQKKTRDLWWQGLPPSVRGRIWILAIGNDLNITSNLYNICLARAYERLKVAEANIESDERNNCQRIHLKDAEATTSSFESGDTNLNKKTLPNSSSSFDEHSQESSMDVIQLDISRTFPNLGIFQEGGPYFTILHELLAAYVCYRPDVGYVQGMSFIAAILILNMEPVDAFICFANLVNRPLMLAAFTVNQMQLSVYFTAYNELFKENLPKLYDHFENASLSPDLYLLDWIYTVFAKAMPLDLACRVWDLYLRDGDEFIFRTALGVLYHYQDALFTMDFLDGAQFLTRLPDDMSSNELFHSIKSMVVSSKKRTFVQLLEKCKDAISAVQL